LVNKCRYQRLAQEQPAASLAPVHDAVAWADVVILATPGVYEAEGIKALGASLGPGVKGKVLIDGTNPLGTFPGLEVHWDGTSGGEILAAALPDTFVYKSFNYLGLEHMEAADGSLINGQQLTMLLAGPEEKRADAEAVVAAAGFVPEYVGPIRYARNMEAITELWVHLAEPLGGFTTVEWGRNFHFQVIKKKQ